MKRKLSALLLLTTTVSMSVMPVNAQMNGGYIEYQDCMAAAQQAYDDCEEQVVQDIVGDGVSGFLQKGPIGIVNGLFNSEGAMMNCKYERYAAESFCGNIDDYSTTSPNFFPDYSRDTDGDGISDQSYYY